MLSSNFYNCGLLVASSGTLISRRQLIYNPGKAKTVYTLGKMEALFTLSFLLPANQKLHSGQHATDSRKSGKQQKESPRDWSWGSARPARPLPQSGGAESTSPCWAAGTPGSRVAGRTLYLPSLAHPCARVLQDTRRFLRGRSGGPWRMPGVGRDMLPWDGDTKREREFAGGRVKTNLRRKRVKTGEGDAGRVENPSST